jgi:hypothetical protein
VREGLCLQFVIDNGQGMVMFTDSFGWLCLQAVMDDCDGRVMFTVCDG